MMMDYSQLPVDILSKIAEEHLQCTFSEFLAFSHVCKSWRNAAREAPGSSRCRPGLLLSRQYSESHELLPLANFAAALQIPPRPREAPRRRLTNPHRRLDIPLGLGPNYVPDPDEFQSPSANPCVSYKDGWVLVVTSHSYPPLQLQLLNPITRQSITLPPLQLPTPLYRYPVTVNSISKAIISSSPQADSSSGDRCHVFLLIYCNINTIVLACIEVGGRDWKLTPLDPTVFTCWWTREASYFGGKLYIVVGQEQHSICVLDNLLTGPTVSALIPFSAAMPSRGCFIHLCHLNGQLLVISRHHHYLEDAPPRLPAPWQFSVEFRVYKLRTNLVGGGERYSWKRVKNLDGHAVFLGHSHPAFCLPASESDGVNPDRIYFAFSFKCGDLQSDHRYGTSSFDSFHRNDCGIFHLARRTLKSFAYRPLPGYNYFWFPVMLRYKHSIDYVCCCKHGTEWTVPKEAIEDHRHYRQQRHKNTTR